MIPRTDDWKNALAAAVRDPAELLALLELPRELLPSARAAAARFGLRVPRSYLARMQKGNPNDPLLRQVLPLGAELETHPGFVADPVGDHAAARSAGLLQKYHGRALLLLTGACAVHCRYCFRRHFPYAEANPASDDWAEALDYLRTDPTLHEVILSGGDPLMFDDERLAGLVDQLAAIPHLRRLRVHSRLPIVLPERVSGALLDALGDSRLQPVMVVHTNHPHELGGTVVEGLRRLQQRGFTLLNQTVLLRGVNDEADTLCALSEGLFAAGVLPYYLHLLDPVDGAAHFEVAADAIEPLHHELACRLPGYLLPRLVREVAGAPYKRPIQSG